MRNPPDAEGFAGHFLKHDPRGAFPSYGGCGDADGDDGDGDDDDDGDGEDDGRVGGVGGDGGDGDGAFHRTFHDCAGEDGDGGGGGGGEDGDGGGDGVVAEHVLPSTQHAAFHMQLDLEDILLEHVARMPTLTVHQVNPAASAVLHHTESNPPVLSFPTVRHWGNH